MMKDISIGRYVQGNSVLHKLDPRMKVLLFIIYMVTLFLADQPVTMLAAVAVVLFVTILSRISTIEVLRSVRPIIFIMIFIFIINVLTIRSGETLWSWWVIKVTYGGLERAVLMVLRLLLLIIATSVLLTLTTTPLKLADALESLGSPLKVIKVPVNEIAMTISIAIRFIPTLVEETDKIMKAQSSRGAEYDTGNVFQRAKGYVAVLVPLFVSAFKRAEELAVAMDARCYQGGVGKTKLHPLRLKASDFLWFFILTVVAFIPVAVDLLPKLI